MEMPNAGELLIAKTREATIREVIEMTYNLVEQTPETEVLRDELHKLLKK